MKGGGGGDENMGMGQRERDDRARLGRGWVAKDLGAKSDFSCHQKDAVSFALWSVSGSMFQRVATALQNDCMPESFFVVFSPKNKVDCMTKGNKFQ